MKYCKNCKQNVEPTKKFSFGWFIVNCLWLVGGVVYIIYFISKKKTCPICKGDNFEHTHSTNEINVIKGSKAVSGYDEVVARMKAERKAAKKLNKIS